MQSAIVMRLHSLVDASGADVHDGVRSRRGGRDVIGYDVLVNDHHGLARA